MSQCDSVLFTHIVTTSGLQVTSHWTSRAFIHQYCAATYTAERFIQQGNIITAAGVSAGIDMALFLAQQLSSSQTAQAIQLAIEYDPQPPFSGAGDFQQADQGLSQETRNFGGRIKKY